jgi:protein-tyrosine phosphatase
LKPIAEGMGIRLFRGYEVYFDAVKDEPDVEICLIQWDRPEKTMLLELDWLEYPERAGGMICEWIRQGVRPVIAHPERYRYVQEDPSIVAEWRAYGCGIQCNAGSWWGSRFGGERKAFRRMLGEGWADYIASDAHRPGHYERLGKMIQAFPPDGIAKPNGGI